MKKLTVILAIMILIVISIFVLSFSFKNPRVISNTEKISVRLPIPVMDATMAPYFATLDSGFFDKQGLEISLNPGAPETNPVKMVVAENDEIGIVGGPDTLLVARGKGLPLVAIAVLHRNSDFPVLITLKDSNITKLEQLQGKKVGFNYGHISADVIRSLFHKENVSVQEVNIGQDYSQLVTKKIDAAWAFRTHGPVNLAAKGIETNIISPKDYGIRTHGLTIFTTEQNIKEQPETIERFLNALFQGLDFTFNNRDEALQSVLTRDSTLTLELERKKLDEYFLPFSNSDLYSMGYMDKQMFQETYDRLKDEGLIEKEFEVSSAFTTQFLDKARK